MSSITEYLKQLETIYGRNLSTEANRYIKIAIKRAKHELDINFIKKCMNNEALPPFSRLKLATKNNQKFINNIRAQITEQELNNKTRNKRHLDEQFKKLYNTLHFTLNQQQWEELTTHIEYKINNIISKKSKIHNKKLEQLGIKIDLTLNSKFVNNSRNKINEVEEIRNKQSIFNY